MTSKTGGPPDSVASIHEGNSPLDSKLIRGHRAESDQPLTRWTAESGLSFESPSAIIVEEGADESDDVVHYTSPVADGLGVVADDSLEKKAEELIEIAKQRIRFTPVRHIPASLEETARIKHDYAGAGDVAPFGAQSTVGHDLPGAAAEFDASRPKQPPAWAQKKRPIAAPPVAVAIAPQYAQPLMARPFTGFSRMDQQLAHAPVGFSNTFMPQLRPFKRAKGGPSALTEKVLKFLEEHQPLERPIIRHESFNRLSELTRLDNKLTASLAHQQVAAADVPGPPPHLGLAHPRQLVREQLVR
eukprot:Selendium_serpulae@DN5376_c0_g1_i1.p1